jgi:hypothetical protein
MKALILVSLSFLMTSFAFAETTDTVYQCADKFYESAGAATKRVAIEQCEKRRDTRFVQCVVSSYNNLAFNHSFESAVANCNVQIPLLTREMKECLAVLQSAQFSSSRAIQLCEWVAPTRTLSIPKCVLRNMQKAENRETNEQLILSCYSQFERFELNKEGVNVEEAERFAKAERARLLKEAELKAQQVEQAKEAERKAAEAQARQQQEATPAQPQVGSAEETSEQPPLPDQDPVP